MEPRSIERGILRRRPLGEIISEASMEPRSIERGIPTAQLGGWVGSEYASMEPRSIERGIAKPEVVKAREYALQWSRARSSAESTRSMKTSSSQRDRFNGAALDRARNRITP